MGTDPATQRDRRALAAVAAQFFANGAMTASFIARAPQIRDRIGVSVDHFGLLLTMAGVGGLAGSLLAGRIVERLHTRRMLQVGAVVLVATLPLMGYARSPVVWVVPLAVYSFFDVLVDISMNLQGSWISARRHMTVMNRLHGVWSLGTFAGGLGAWAANAAGVSPFGHLTAVAVVMAVGLAVLTRHLLAHDEDRHEDAPASGTAVSGPARLAVALIVLAGVFAVVLEVTGGDWAAFRLSDDFGSTAAIASLAFVAYTVGSTAMRFGGDWLQHRLGRDGLHRLSVGISLVGFVVATLIPSQAVSLAGFFLVGVGVATFMPKLYDDAARLPGRRGAGLGAMTAGMRFAALGAPAAVGVLAATSLSIGQAIAIVTLPSVAGLLVASTVAQRWVRRPNALGR